MDSMRFCGRQGLWNSASPGVQASPPVPVEETGSMDSQDAGQIVTSAPDCPSPVRSDSCVSVSPCSAAGRRAGFDFLLLDVAAPVQALLDAQGAGGDEVVLVQEPEGLLQDSLTLRSCLTDSGVLHRAPGRLFCDDAAQRPLCLVLDCRTLSGARLTSYNDVLDPDKPSLYDRFSNSRQPLGSHVRILVLLSRQQYLAEADAASLPGQDFWRRVVRPALTVEWTGPAGEQDLLPPVHAGERVYDDTAEVIDFHLQGDWRRTLYGRVGTDDHGRMCFFAGALARLSAGQRIILRGADWSDPVFCHEWLKLQRTGIYESNGCQCRLPDGLTFVRSTLDAEERQWLGQCISRQKNPVQEAIVVNRHNLYQWLAQGCVTEDGSWQQRDALQERLVLGAGLIVTTPLGEAGWLSLLSRLRAAQQGLSGIGVFLAHDDPADSEVVPQLAGEQNQAAGDDDAAAEAMESDQVADLELAGVQTTAGVAALQTVLSPRVRIRSWQDADQITAWLEQQQSSAVQPPLVIRVHPGTRLGVLFDDLHVLSGQRPLFGRRETALEQALTAGQPVVIRGLETNAELQWQLESLLCQPPSLLINGRWRHFPAADVTLLWPDSTRSPSPLWQQALVAAAPLAAVDPWEALRRRWPLDDSQIAPLRQAVTGLLRAWSSLPSGLTAQAGSPPVLTAALLDNLVAAALHQAHQEGTEPAPHHWRRAIDAVLSHRSRGCPPVRDFLKAVCIRLWPDAGPADWIDPERLASVMPEKGILDRAFFKEHLWTLMRALGPGWLAQLPLQFYPDCTDGELALLVALLNLWGADCCQQMAVEEGLEPDEAQRQQLRKAPIRCSQRLKRLGDALAAGWCRKEKNQDIYPALLDLSAASWQLRQGDLQAQIAVQTRLQAVLAWEGAAELEEAASLALARDLLHGRTDQADRRQRRLARLRQRLEQTPVLMIEGPTATGKSYFAARVAHQAGPAWVVSVGAGTAERDLVQRWVWKDKGQDRTMQACDQVILEWARNCPASASQLVTLVIDEANLAAPGVLDSLKGLWNRPPCVYIKGEPVQVSDRHRVILTGNPVGYAGRRCDLDFAQLAVRVHFPRLDDDFLCQQVVLPGLESHLARHVSPELMQETAVTLVRVWNLCQHLLPDRVFTPRDLVDLCAWLGWYVSQSDGAPASAGGWNALVLQAVRDLLEGECDEAGQQALQALEVWMEARVPLDKSAPERWGGGRSAWQDSCFVQYARQAAPDFATSPPAVMALVAAVNRDLDRCRQARKGCLAAGRRQATLIEGPAGRGKDATLGLLLDNWKRQCRQDAEPLPEVRTLCASDCPWQSLCEAFRQARSLGQVLVISELNLVESQYLEGELNAALAGEAAPGFHLFATINPLGAGFSGRNDFSPALLGRFRRLVVPDYSQDELASIALQTAAGQVEEAQVRQLSDWHRQLCQAAQHKGLMLRPVNKTLIQLVQACKGCPPHDIPALFDSHYKMYLLAASTDRARLGAVTPVNLLDEVPHHALTAWVNRCAWLDRPLTVWEGPVARQDWEKGRLVLPSGLPDQQMRALLQRELLKVRWQQETGLPLRLAAAGGMEALLLGRMQQLWSQQLPEAEREPALALFSLSPAQQQTLNLPCNRSQVLELERLYRSWPQHSWPQHSWPQHSWPQHSWQWQSLWHRIQALCWQSGRGEDSSSFMGPVSAGSRLEQHALLDGRTDGDARPPAEFVLPGTFGLDHDDRLSRIATSRPAFINGSLTTEWIQPGRLGFEVMLPEALEPDEVLRLNPRQHYGIHPLRYANDWQSLPGVHAADRLVLMRTDPPRKTRVLKDSDSGLHYVQFLDAGAGGAFQEQVMVHFVLEVPDAGNPGGTQSVRLGVHPDACCDPVLRQRLDAFLTADNRSRWSRDTKEALQKIVQACSQENRVWAISRYCREFKADRAPEPGDDLLQFLLRERQGSCRHRAWIYVLLCRRWGIAARMVDGCGHRFVEYSLDAGRSWKAQDLGGARSLLHRGCGTSQAAFPPYWRGFPGRQDVVLGLGADDQRILLANLKAADWNQLTHRLAQQACPVEPAALQQTEVSLDYACRLSEAALLGSLLASRVTEEFLLGCRLMKTTGRLTEASLQLVAPPNRRLSFLADVASQLCLQAPGVQMPLRQQLTELKICLCRQGEHQRWRHMLRIFCDNTLYEMRNNNDLAAAGQDMLCWLMEQGDLQLQTEDFRYRDIAMYGYLRELANMKTCRSLAQQQLLQWHKAFFSLRPLADPFREAPELMAGDIPFRAWKPSCYAGRLPSLESALFSHGVGETWTDQPEAMPDVERLLTHRPAFRTSRAVMTQGRRVLDFGNYSASTECLYEHATRVLDRITSSEDQASRLETHCSHLISWAFFHCLYDTICKAGGTLDVQTAWMEERAQRCYSSGLISITSLEQLVRIQLVEPEGLRRILITTGDQEACVQKSCNLPDALVLSSTKKYELLEEFLASMDIEAFIQDMGHRLTRMVGADDD